MKHARTYIIIALASFVLGGLLGFFIGKSVYQSTPSVKVDRDTVTVHDTVPDLNPTPRDSVRIKFVTKWLPLVKHTTDTVTQWETLTVHDSVAVEVPITQKHYQANEYDAWVSGYEPSMDSIKVYQQTKYITETITVTNNAKRKPWGIGFTGGYGYDFTTKTAAPFIGVGISYNILNF